jgi:hypothetical protein
MRPRSGSYDRSEVLNLAEGPPIRPAQRLISCAVRSNCRRTFRRPLGRIRWPRLDWRSNGRRRPHKRSRSKPVTKHTIPAHQPGEIDLAGGIVVMKHNAGRNPHCCRGIEGQVATAPKSLQATEIRWKRSPSLGDDHGLTTSELNAMSRYTTICFIQHGPLAGLS